MPLDFSHALDKLHKQTLLLRTHQALLQHAHGLIAAAPITASLEIPRERQSSMDGFGLHISANWPKAHTPIPVQGRVLAGDTVSQAKNGYACEIMTGATLPNSINTIVPYEACTRDPTSGHITLHSVPKVGTHVRPIGSDVAKGSVLIAKGQTIHTGQLMQCLQQKIRTISTYAPTRIGIVYTGKEVSKTFSDQAPRSHIANSTASYFQTVCPALNLRVTKSYYSKDSVKRFANCIQRLTHDPDIDLILTVGGVSQGKTDLVRPTLREQGWHMLFEKIRIKPGGPASCFRLNHQILFALPGNPLSSICVFEHLIYPWIQTQRHEPARPKLQVPIHTEHGSTTEKTLFLAANLVKDSQHRLQARILTPQASYQLSPLSQANYWAILPPHPTWYPKGFVATLTPMLIHHQPGVYPYAPVS